VDNIMAKEPGPPFYKNRERNHQCGQLSNRDNVKRISNFNTSTSI
jgi:hypothetical protein